MWVVSRRLRTLRLAWGKPVIGRLVTLGMQHLRFATRIPGEIGDTILVFGSDTEMASQDGQINFIQIIGPGGSFTEQQNCSPLHSSVAQPLVASNGLRLGMSLAEVTSIYGKATSFKGGLAQFSSCHKRYLLESDPYFKRWVGKAGCFEDPSRPYFDECSLVKVYFKRGRAISITVSMNQSV